MRTLEVDEETIQGFAPLRLGSQGSGATAKHVSQVLQTAGIIEEK